RKARLFACAACRRMWDALEFPGSRKAIEASELYADRLIKQAKLSAACGAAQKAWLKECNRPDSAERRNKNPTIADAAIVAAQAAHAVSASALLIVARKRLTNELPEESARSAMHYASLVNGEAAAGIEGVVLSDLVRDIFGNPFRSAVIDP